MNYLPRFSPQLISLERYTLSVYRAGDIDLFENLDIVHLRLLVKHANLQGDEEHGQSRVLAQQGGRALRGDEPSGPRGVSRTSASSPAFTDATQLCAVGTGGKKHPPFPAAPKHEPTRTLAQQAYLRKRVLKLVFLSQFPYKFVNLCGEQRIS